MEACFLSNSLTKTCDLVPLINSRFLTSSKKNTFLKYRLGTSTITCCQSGASSSNEDWRSFRAKLVATQRLTKVEDSSSAADVDPPKVILGDKWAHPIHQPEKGCLLIATEKLEGVHIFERTVILLLATDCALPTGIILNRPSLMSIKETKSTVLDMSETFKDKPLFFGGPLDGGMFLVSTQSDEDDIAGKSGVFEEVMKGLHYGTKETVGCIAEMVKRDVVKLDDIKFFDGYCAWDKAQLQEELQAGYWTIAASSPSLIELETMKSGAMWEDVLGLIGSKKVW